MKNWDAIAEAAELEIKHWFPKQCQNQNEDYYWYYEESTAEHNGGFLICKEQPANPEYKLATPERLGKGITKEQNLRRFLNVARFLPILEP